MLPWLKSKRTQPVMVDEIKKRNPDMMDQPEQSEDMEMLEHMAKELIDCIHAKDHKGVAQALHAFFEVADGMPHEEGPHEEEME